MIIITRIITTTIIIIIIVRFRLPVLATVLVRVLIDDLLLIKMAASPSISVRQLFIDPGRLPCDRDDLRLWGGGLIPLSGSCPR